MQDFVIQYLEGVDLYHKADWKAVSQSMERALKGYLEAEEVCRVECEKPFDMGWQVIHSDDYSRANLQTGIQENICSLIVLVLQNKTY